MKARTGDLIYVPSEVLLYTTDETAPNTIKEWKKTKKPEHLLITSIHDAAYEVLYENNYWLVKKNKVYYTRS